MTIVTLINNSWYWLRNGENYCLFACSTGRQITPVGRIICRPRLTAFKEFSLRVKKSWLKAIYLYWNVLVMLIEQTNQLTSWGGQWPKKISKEANPPGDMDLWMSKLKVRGGFNQLCLQPPQAREHLPKSNICLVIWKEVGFFFFNVSPGENRGVGIFEEGGEGVCS